MIEANLKVRYRKLDEVRAFEGNARTHSDKQIEQLVAVIKKVGFGNPIQIDEAGTILAGHGRVLAARKIGHGEDPDDRAACSRREPIASNTCWCSASRELRAISA